MNRQLPLEIKNEKNYGVLNFLESLSCHSDIIIPLENCMKIYDDVRSFCPNPGEFKFVVWYVGDVIFAFATGMQEVALRVGNTYPASGFQHQKLEGWYSFPYDSKELCKYVGTAYEHATSS